MFSMGTRLSAGHDYHIVVPCSSCTSCGWRRIWQFSVSSSRFSDGLLKAGVSNYDFFVRAGRRLRD